MEPIPHLKCVYYPAKTRFDLHICCTCVENIPVLMLDDTVTHDCLVYVIAAAASTIRYIYKQKSKWVEKHACRILILVT